MATENKKEELDFEFNDTENTNKKSKMGKKASATAMAAGAAVAGGATALGAEAAMSLADESIIDPEQVSDAIADSTVEIVHPKVTVSRPRVVEPEIEPTQDQLDNINEAATHVATDNAAEESETLDLADGEDIVEIEEIIEPLPDIEDISGEDIAMILEENVEVPEITEEVMPIVDDIDGIAQVDDIDDFSTIDDLDMV